MDDDATLTPKKKKRAPAKRLDSKTFKDGAFYLFRRADYVKPIWFIRIKVPGVKGYLSKSSKTTDEHAAYKAAEDYYNQTLGKLHGGVKLNSKRISLGLNAFITHHQERQINESIKHTITLANRLKSFVKLKTFDEIDTPLVAEMMETISKQSRKGKLSPNTIKRTQSHLKLMMNWWVDNGYLEKVPAFPKVSAKKNRRPHFDTRDWSKLTRYLREFIKIDHGPVRRDRMLLVNYVLILANTGIRVGEARILKWRDIRPFKNPEDPTAINVALMVTGKTGMRETVARTGEVRKYFERILKLRRADLTNEKSDIFGKKDVPVDSYVFCGLNGKPILSFKNSFNSLIEKAGVTTDSFGQRRTIYSLRHTYATFRLQEGVNQYALARNMGTSVAMLEDYYGHTTNVGMVGELTKTGSGRKKTGSEAAGSAFDWLSGE